MRLIVWGMVVIALGYAAYAGMMSAWSYLMVAGAVDEVLPQSADPRELKTKILQSANEAGVPLQEREVIVSRDDRGTVRVEVIWTFPVVFYKGETVFAVPMSLSRTKLPTRSGLRHFPGVAARASAIILATRSRSSPAGDTATNFSHERIAPGTSRFDS